MVQVVLICLWLTVYKLTRCEIRFDTFHFDVVKCRIAKELAMVELASKCGVEPGTISTIERGIVNRTIHIGYITS
jgi:hypothetical protein